VSALIAVASRDAVAARCRRIVGDTLGLLGSEIDDESRFDGARTRGDLGADSLDMVSIAMELEDEFGIAIPDAEAESVDTFGALVDLIVAKIGSGGGAA
jgi:acyl carrier protein